MSTADQSSDLEALKTELSHLDEPRQQTALHAYQHLIEHGDPNEEDMREVLKTFYDGRIFEPVATYILANKPDLAKRVGDSFLRFARRPKELAVTHTFIGVMVEREHDALTAEQHVRAALDTRTDWPLAVDRAAWYASDRGDAHTASRLWRSIFGPDDMQVRIVAPFTATDSSLNRNEPCWCGSGRKFKHCHFGAPRKAELADRVGWLEAKITFYVERAGRRATDDTDAMARAYVGASDNSDENSDEDIERALQTQPLIADAVTFEKGWLANFIEDRGPLLPEDESKLLASWTDSKREIVEVIDVERGTGVVVRALGGAEPLMVRERTYSTTASKGDLICARIVTDGEGLQFVGGLLSIAPGTETEMKAALDSGSVEDFLAGIRKPE